MNIWQWVLDAHEALRTGGHERLARLMVAIPTHSSHGEHDQLDALMDEALFLVRQQDNPWVEIFIRHWHLQSQVLHRHKGRDMLDEAVALLEFASRDETRDCPQSICVVQDLVNCYGTIDGPGYAQQRLAVVDETLARIDPSWPCYRCIGSERISALIDAGRLADEREAREALRRDLTEAGETSFGSLLVGEANLELRSGNFPRALELAQAAQDEEDEGGLSFELSREIVLARAHASMGDVQHALAVLPTADRVDPEPGDYLGWCQAWSGIVEIDGTLNTAGRRQVCWQYAEGLRNAGCIRDGISIYGHFVELAAKAGEWFTAGCALERIDMMIPDLAQDLGATTEQAARRARVLEAETEVHAGNAGNIDARVDGTTIDREKTLACAKEDPSAVGVELCRRLKDQHPEDVECARLFAQTLAAAGLIDAAVSQWRRMLAANPDDHQSLEAMGAALLEASDLARFDELLTSLDLRRRSLHFAGSTDRVVARRFEDAQPAAALERLEQILSREPLARDVLESAAALARNLGLYEQALGWIDQLIDAVDEPDTFHLDRMVVATMINRFDLVRDSARALDLDLPGDSGEGPVRCHTHPIRVNITSEDQTFEALWTGPVTAEINELMDTDAVYLGYDVVFDPRPRNVLDQRDEEGSACDAEGERTLLYDALRTTPGREFLVFELDGIHPGEELWEQLVARADDLGVMISRGSGETYTVHDFRDEQDYLGIYAVVAVPHEVQFALVDALFQEIVDRAGRPMIWPVLLEAMNAGEKLQEQAELEKLLDMEG